MDKQDRDLESNALPPSSPYLRRVIADFYRDTLDGYMEAGYPFGNTVDAMLIWFEFGLKSTSN
ncbi:MAG: hypothetical protein SH809_01520 [Rhodothermales bacterium]|jgi:hypothetical protein|nr:hypothetical protein [Rhodothermales bacterium]